MGVINNNTCSHMSNWDNRGEDPSGPLQAGKSRPLLTGDLRATSGDGLQNAPPTKHIRSHSFFSFGSKKGAQEQAQQALETVPQSPTSAEHVRIYIMLDVLSLTMVSEISPGYADSN